VAKKPDKVPDLLPDNVTYDAATNTLTHTYRGGSHQATELNALSIAPVDLFDPAIRTRREDAIKSVRSLRA